MADKKIKKKVIKRGKSFLLIVFSLMFLISFVSAQIIERGSYWNKIDNGGGVYSLEIYNTIINYYNETEYVPIYIKINSSNYLDYEYEMTSNPLYKIYFQNNIQAGKGIRFEKDGYYFTYDLSGGKMQWAEQPGNPTKTKSIGAILSSPIVIESNNSVSYNTAFSDTNINYALGNSMLKENYILNTLPSGGAGYLYLEYTGEIQHSPNLTIYANGENQTGKDFKTNGSIEFKDGNKTIFYLPSPYAADAVGNYSTAIYDIKISAEKIAFGLKVPVEFVGNATYPITIDPTITISGNGADSYIYENSNNNYGSSSVLEADSESGKNERILLFFNLSQLPQQSIIYSAILELYLTSGTGNNFNLSLYRLTRNWTESRVNWNTYNGTASWTNPGGDYASTEYSKTFVNSTARWNSWNTTHLIQELVNGTSINYGFILIPQSQAGNNYKQFASKENANQTIIPKLTINYTYDIVAPTLSNLTENPANSSGYISNQVYKFNVTINETNLASVGIEFNGTNYTSSTYISNISNIYMFNKSNLAAGVYTYYWWANDTLGNFNVSEARYYTISKAIPVLTFLANSGTSNLTLTYPQQVNITATASAGTLGLEQDETNYLSNNGLNITLAAGSYIFRANITGNQNYSDVAYSYYNVTINKASQTASLNINESSPIIYGTYINVTCNGELFRNSNLVNSEKSQSVLLGAGGYNYSCQLPESQNYSYDDDNATFVVNQASSQTSLTFDKTSPQFYGTSVNATCSVLTGQGNAVLTLNGNTINSGQVLILGAGNWNFNCSLAENQNYSYSENFSSFTIDKASPAGNMIVTGTSSVIYNTISDFLGTETNSGDDDCVYSVDKENRIYGVGTWTFNYSTSGCENYTAGSVTKDLIVNKATPMINISGNSSIVYGTAADIIATESNTGDADLTYSLYRNGILLSRNNDTGILAADSYSYIYATSGGQNYTSMGVNFDLVVNKANSTTSLTFDKTSPQIYGIEINVSCSTDNPEGNLKLYRNDIDVTAIENFKLIVLSAGNHSYICNVSETQNYTSASSYNGFVIEKEIGDIKLYLNGLEGNLTIWSIEESNITTTTLYGSVIIYKNGEDITSENGQSLIRNPGYYNITAVSSGDENHSSVSITRWLNITEDLISPSISLIAPRDGDAYGYNENIALDFIVSDENLQSCWYNLDGGQNVSINNCENTTFDVSGNGGYTLYLYANDSYGNEDKLEINFSVQLDAPTIILHSPIRVYLNYTNITFKYTPNDMDLQACELWGNFDGVFKLNQTNNAPLNYSENQFNLTLPEGNYTWNIKCNDSQGHSAFNGNKIFYVDTTAPSITINEPKGTKSSWIGVPLSFSVNDSSPVNCKYSVSWATGGSVVSNTSIANCLPITSITFNLSSVGDYILSLYVTDYAGNFNLITSSFTISTSIQPPVNPPSGGGGGGGYSKPKNISANLSLGKLEITKIPNLIVDAGESKKIILSVKNSGTGFLNDCKLKGKRDNAEWISAEGIKGLSAGEKYDFVFTLKVPEKLEAGSYKIELEVSCQETNKSTEFNAEIIEKKLTVEVVDVKRESKDKVNITYSLKELSGSAQDVEVELVLLGDSGERLATGTRKDRVEANSIKKSEIVLNIPEELVGNFNLLINAVSKNSSTFVQEDIVLGPPGIGGLAIAGGTSGGTIFSVILIALFIIFAFFIIRKIWKLRKLKKRLKINRVELK